MSDSLDVFIGEVEPRFCLRDRIVGDRSFFFTLDAVDVEEKKCEVRGLLEEVNGGFLVGMLSWCSVLWGSKIFFTVFCGRRFVVGRRSGGSDA